MPIIVAGYLIINSGERDNFVEKSKDAIELARNHSACDDFSVSPDPCNPDRVNIFEKWSSSQALQDFRNEGDDSDVFDFVKSFHVNEYDI